jgi:hypothetical protein
MTDEKPSGAENWIEYFRRLAEAGQETFRFRCRKTSATST